MIAQAQQILDSNVSRIPIPLEVIIMIWNDNNIKQPDWLTVCIPLIFIVHNFQQNWICFHWWSVLGRSLQNISKARFALMFNYWGYYFKKFKSIPVLVGIIFHKINWSLTNCLVFDQLLIDLSLLGYNFIVLTGTIVVTI